MQRARRSQAERNAETRAALLRAARRRFAESGYADTGTEEIVEAAGVTRGALYHHFTDKAALFEAVVEAIAAEILAAIIDAARTRRSAFAALEAGCAAFLDAALAPEVRRIYLVDAVAVLGWARWRAIDARYGMGSLRTGIANVLKEQPDAAVSLDAATHILSGALNEAALWLAEAEDEAAARRRFDQTFRALLRRLFNPSRSA